MAILSKIARKIAKKAIKKKPASTKTKSKLTPKKKTGSSGVNVKGPITRGKKELRKIIGKPLNTKAEKVVGKRTTAKAKSDYVTIPKKAYTDEEKYDKMMRSGKKLTDAQLKAYSKAVKFTVDNMIEIDGRQYVTRKAKQTLKGTVAHALDEMSDFLPKKYLDLYKKK
tara:strand:- start:358 stop:861 length:504 start_codon:yes stop_codon:yes gene_type:complete